MDVQVGISVYAIIVIDDQVLLTQDEDKSGYKLPGGGVEFNESMIDALKREVKEELNLDVTPKSMIDFHEYINKKEFTGFDYILRLKKNQVIFC